MPAEVREGTTAKKVYRKKVPIIIPGAENMTPEELKKAKHNEKMRRYMNRRNGNLDPGEIKKTNKELLVMTTGELVQMSQDVRNRAVSLLNKKLRLLEQDEEALMKLSMKDLSTAFGILFDKAQLAQGLSTENIAIHTKIDINMTSDKALEELNKMREQYVESNS